MAVGANTSGDGGNNEAFVGEIEVGVVIAGALLRRQTDRDGRQVMYQTNFPYRYFGPYRLMPQPVARGLQASVADA